MLQDHSLKIRKTCDTCEKKSCISLGVLLFSCLNICDAFGIFAIVLYFVKKVDNKCREV